MTTLSEEWLPYMKMLIEKDRLDVLQHLYNELLQPEHSRLSWSFLWKHAYLHACIKHKTQIKDWLLQLYQTFSEVDQIGLKPTLNYAKYLK